MGQHAAEVNDDASGFANGCSGENDLLKDLSFFANFCVLLSWFMSAGVVLARLGLPMPPRLLLVCLAVFSAAAYAPFLLSRLALQRLARHPWALSLPTLTLFLSPVAALVLGPGVLTIYPVLAVLGAVRSRPYWRRPGLRRVHVLAILGPLLLSAYLFGQVAEHKYATVYAPEFATLGILKGDTYFHTAVASMIQNEGTASIGADGPRTIRYHVGSHYWFASIGTMAGELPIYAYPFGLMIVALPMLFLLLFVATRTVVTGDAVPAVGLVIGSAGFVVLFDQISMSTFYISESYLFGVLVTLAAVPVLASLIGTREATRRATLAKFGVLIALVLIGMAMKVSAGLILAAATGYLLIRGHRLVRVLAPVSLGLAVVVTIGTLAFRDGSGVGKISFRLLDYFRPWRSATLVSCLIVPLILIVILRRDARSTNDSVRRVARRRELELVLIVTLVAMGPALALDLHSINALHFLDLARWFALPLLLASIPASDVREVGHLLFASRTGLVLGPIVFISFVIPVSRIMYAPHQLARLTRPMLDALNTGTPGTRRVPASVFFRTSLQHDRRLFGRSFTDALAATYASKTVREVQGVTRSKGKVAVFVPPDNIAFWSLPERCVSAPFVIPALTGVPMMKGLPAKERVECHPAYLGFPDYPPGSKTESLGDSEVCTHARSRELETVVVLRPAEPDSNEVSVLDCRLKR